MRYLFCLTFFIVVLSCTLDSEDVIFIDLCEEQPIDESYCMCEVWSFDNTPHSTVDEIELEFVENFLNPYRLSLGSDPLKMNDTLSLVAQRHANDMANRDYFDHTTLL